MLFRSLTLEITKSILVAGEPIDEVLGELRGMGVTIAIDDFATGYSSLAYLQRFPISTVKVDRAFVVATPTRPRPRTGAKHPRGG